MNDLLPSVSGCCLIVSANYEKLQIPVRPSVRAAGLPRAILARTYLLLHSILSRAFLRAPASDRPVACISSVRPSEWR